MSATGTQEPVVAPATPTVTPDWFNMELTDVQTGETFTMNDYAGKVGLLSLMLIIDRAGNVHHLEYGLRKAEILQKIVEPYLAK